MESEQHNYFRYVFSAAFALGATAALFVLLDFLVTAQPPLKTTALNPTTNIRVRSITVTPKKSQTPQQNTKAIASKAEKTQPQQTIAQQPASKHRPQDKQLSSLVKAIPAETKPIKARPVKAQAVKAELAKIEVDLKPATREAVELAEEAIQLTENTNNLLTQELAPVLNNVNPKSIQPSKPAPQSKTISSETDIHNTKTYAPTIVDAKQLKKIHSPNPNYPRKAQRRNIQGWVMTNFQIRSDGSVAQIEIIDGKNATFFKREVIKTLESWVFEKDQLQDIKASMRFVFSLRS